MPDDIKIIEWRNLEESKQEARNELFLRELYSLSKVYQIDVNIIYSLYHDVIRAKQKVDHKCP